MVKGQRRMQVARKFFPHRKMGARRAYHTLFKMRPSGSLAASAPQRPGFLLTEEKPEIAAKPTTE